MFYIERSVQGPPLCSDLHDCLCVNPINGGMEWRRYGEDALAFETKKDAEEYCAAKGYSLDNTGNEFDPRYIIVEELRLPEVQDIAYKHGAKCVHCYCDAANGYIPYIIWGDDKTYRIQVLRNKDVSTKHTSSQHYTYVVGARLIRAEPGRHGFPTVLEEIHNPSYEELDRFVEKCIVRGGVVQSVK